MESTLLTAKPESQIGKILRLPLRVIPGDLAVPILRGPLKGSRWVKGSTVNSVWLGTYELDRLQQFDQLLRLGDTFFDIGANVGVYSLVAANRVGANGKIFAFEPLPKNITYLRRHRELNDLKNIEVVESAVGNRNGVVKFDIQSHRATGRISDSGQLTVPITTLDGFVSSESVSSLSILKIDVEGAEYDVLLGARATLEEFRPKILIEYHSDDLQSKCTSFLKELGYRVEDQSGSLLAKKAV